MTWWQHRNLTIDIDAREHPVGEGHVEMPLLTEALTGTPVVTLVGHGTIWPRSADSEAALRSAGVAEEPRLSADGKRLIVVVPGGQSTRIVASMAEYVSI